MDIPDNIKNSWLFRNNWSNFYIVIVCICFILSAGSLIGAILLTFHQTDSCPQVESCYYQIKPLMNSTVYSYYYVINNQYTCSNFCKNPIDLSSCPINNTSCDVTSETKDFCKYQGFGHLFKSCTNGLNFWLLVICLWLMLIFLVYVCCFAKLAYIEALKRKTQKAPSPLTTPSVNNPV